MTVPSGSSPVLSSMWGRMGNSAPRGAYGGFGAEGLHDLVARFEVGPADQVDAVGHGGEDALHEALALGILQALERLLDRLGLARQVEDEAFRADHRDLSREDRGRHELEADAPHLLAEA